MITSPIVKREEYFSYLLSSVSSCDICDRMCARKKVLSTKNGNLHSKIVFIAEAPGRLGAECTGIPLYGDKTGENFETLIGNIGWKREDIFITNAVLCNPQNENGNNDTPTKDEIENCSYYLEMTLEILNPDIIVTLGIKALDALKYIKIHDFSLRDCVAQKLAWNGRYIFPLYHVGPRAIIHRRMAQQRADFITLSHIINPRTGLKKPNQTKKEVGGKTKSTNNTLLDMVMAIVAELKTVSFFKLTKLLYLIDYDHYKQNGYSMSGCVYLRMQEGPWIPSLKNISNENDGKLLRITYNGRKPIVSHIHNEYVNGLTDEQQVYIKACISRYSDSSDSIMKIAAYRTEPMRYIKEQEDKGRNMTRIPVLYKDSCVLDVDRESKIDRTT